MRHTHYPSSIYPPYQGVKINTPLVYLNCLMILRLEHFRGQNRPDWEGGGEGCS